MLFRHFAGFDIDEATLVADEDEDDGGRRVKVAPYNN
jgi:hypothetical protein